MQSGPTPIHAPPAHCCRPPIHIARGHRFRASLSPFMVLASTSLGNLTDLAPAQTAQPARVPMLQGFLCGRVLGALRRTRPKIPFAL